MAMQHMISCPLTTSSARLGRLPRGAFVYTSQARRKRNLKGKDQTADCPNLQKIGFRFISSRREKRGSRLCLSKETP